MEEIADNKEIKEQARLYAEKEYIETKEECQEKINAAGTVCSQCGGVITPIETVDNSGRPTFWMGCEPCSRFDYGVKPLIYQIAKIMVLERNHVAYSHMDYPGKDKSEEYKKYWTETQIGGTSNLVREILRIHAQLTENK